jgi:4-hydroxybenzoate polyprenyltransferase
MVYFEDNNYKIHENIIDIMKPDLKFFIKFYRASDWIKVLGLVLIPCLLCRSSFFDFLKLISITALLLAYGFSINDFFDFKCRGEKNLIGKVYRKEKYKVISLLLFPPLLLMLFIFSLSTFLSRVFFILDFFLFSFYSIPPIRLRDRKILDVISNSLMFSIIIIFSFFYFISTTDIFFYFFYFIYFIYFLISELIHEISHFVKDKSSGRISTVIWLGKKYSLWLINLILLFESLFSFVFIFQFSHPFKIFPLVSLFFIVMRIKRINSWSESFSRLRKRIYGMAEGLVYIGLILFLNYFNYF